MIDCSAGQRFPSAQTLDLYRVTQFGMDVIGLVSSNRPETACSDQKSPLSGHETAASGFADRFRHAEFCSLHRGLSIFWACSAACRRARRFAICPARGDRSLVARRRRISVAPASNSSATDCNRAPDHPRRVPGGFPQQKVLHVDADTDRAIGQGAERQQFQFVLSPSFARRARSSRRRRSPPA